MLSIITRRLVVPSELVPRLALLRTLPNPNKSVRCFAHLKSQEAMLKSKIKEVKFKEPADRYSPHDNRASKLITFVENREYQRALSLVNQGGLSPDAHSSGENTVLTDCAKRGDVNGMKFCLNELGANPYTSCHCPLHQSAFHYASMNGHIECLKVLYEHIDCKNNLYADHKNLLTSSGKTPLDVAKNKQTRDFMLNYKAKSKIELSQTEHLKLTAPDR